MRVLKRQYKTYLVAISLCISMSGLLVISNGSSTYAKSIPESIADWVSGRGNSKSDDSKKAPAVVATPTVTPTPPAQQAATATAQKQTTTTTTVAGTPPVPSKPADTSLQVRQVATAQALKTNLPSSYPSAKISTSERDNLYKASMVVAAAGVLIYLLSFAPMWHWMYKNSTVTQSKIITE